MHLRICKHCGKVCKIVCKHGKYCDECRQLITKRNQYKSKIIRYTQVIDEAQHELDILIIRLEEIENKK